MPLLVMQSHPNAQLNLQVVHARVALFSKIEQKDHQPIASGGPIGGSHHQGSLKKRSSMPMESLTSVPRWTSTRRHHSTYSTLILSIVARSC